jgi:hypothetical protein
MLCQPSPPKAHAQALVRWKLLRDHDTAEVIATIDDAFADNASLSACIDAGTTHNGNCVTLVVRYPGPGIAQGIVQAGTNTRPRSENEIMDLYRRAVASTVIATAKEAFCCAPAATEAYAVLLRYDYDMRGRFRKQPSQLDAIYAGALDRSVLGIDWNIQKPIDVMLAARNVRINQDRKGRFKPLRDDAGDDLRALVENIAAATESAPPGRRKRRRYTTRESQRLLRSQEQEEFLVTAACPGCGELNTHAMRTPHQGDPSWAEVIRICGVCNREWAHG